MKLLLHLVRATLALYSLLFLIIVSASIAYGLEGASAYFYYVIGYFVLGILVAVWLISNRSNFSETNFIVISVFYLISFFVPLMMYAALIIFLSLLGGH